MVRYRYVDHLQPPAPFVNVSLHCQATGARLDNQPALVDSAADRTILPVPTIRGLGLVEDGRLQFQGFASRSSNCQFIWLKCKFTIFLHFWSEWLSAKTSRSYFWVGTYSIVTEFCSMGPRLPLKLPRREEETCGIQSARTR